MILSQRFGWCWRFLPSHFALGCRGSTRAGFFIRTFVFLKRCRCEKRNKHLLYSYIKEKKEENTNLFNSRTRLTENRKIRYNEFSFVLLRVCLIRLYVFEFFKDLIEPVWINRLKLKRKGKVSILSDKYVYILVPPSFLLSHQSFRKYLSKVALYLSRIEE